ncbi:hypothetical protein FIA58_020530 [Flavobacterium jejuense]|uniref:Uncharacterized protein n=1 Tax=Flavobacterium jejuense TaxID=1544455 RepID=A0ABX0IWZ2_9FLAO|nr:hypothetical protein [Flavobacterium jejuense]NHN28071.1 hypothetical protein [Flavobacterium jejuense]
MKKTLLLLFTCIACNSQSKFEIKNSKYYSKIIYDNQNSILEVERKSDSLHAVFKIKPNLLDLLNKYFLKDKTTQVSMIIEKINNKLFITQIVFFNGKNQIILHEGTADLYGDLKIYSIEVISCKNCKDKILIPIYIR